MKKYLFRNIALALIFIGCNLKQSNPLAEKAYRFLASNLHESDSTMRLDSAIIVRFIPITDKTLYTYRTRIISDSLEHYVKIGQLTKEIAETHLRQARLYREISATLSQDAKETVEKDLQELKEYREIGLRLSDEADRCLKMVSVADSTTARYYQYYVLRQIRKKNGAIMRDTAFVYFTKEYDVIEENEILRRVK